MLVPTNGRRLSRPKSVMRTADPSATHRASRTRQQIPLRTILRHRMRPLRTTPRAMILSLRTIRQPTTHRLTAQVPTIRQRTIRLPTVRHRPVPRVHRPQRRRRRVALSELRRRIQAEATRRRAQANQAPPQQVETPPAVQTMGPVQIAPDRGAAQRQGRAAGARALVPPLDRLVPAVARLAVQRAVRPLAQRAAARAPAARPLAQPRARRPAAQRCRGRLPSRFSPSRWTQR